MDRQIIGHRSNGRHVVLGTFAPGDHMRALTRAQRHFPRLPVIEARAGDSVLARRRLVGGAR